jgi:hypothetical protein
VYNPSIHPTCSPRSSVSHQRPVYAFRKSWASIEPHILLNLRLRNRILNPSSEDGIVDQESDSRPPRSSPPSSALCQPQLVESAREYYRSIRKKSATNASYTKGSSSTVASSRRVGEPLSQRLSIHTTLVVSQRLLVENESNGNVDNEVIGRAKRKSV